MLKRMFFKSLKFILAFGLIAWLINSGKLDMSLLEKTMDSPLILISIMLFMLFDNAIAAVRWKYILEYKDKTKISLFKVFKANWIGLFFNCVLPGAVSGDLIKIFYIQDKENNWTKKYLFATAFLDRLLGLFGLVSVGAISCLISYDYLISLSPNVKNLIHFNFLLFFGVITSFVMVFWFQDLPLKISAFFKKIQKLESIMEKLEIMWKDLCDFKHNLLIYLLISMIVQGTAVCIFWYVVSPYTEVPFDLKKT